MRKETSKIKKILGAAIGNCIHVAGLNNFLDIAEQEGYTTICLGPAVSVPKLVQEIEQLRPDIVAVSYRLTPENATALFIELKDAIQQHKLASRRFILGGTPPVATVGRETGIFEAVFSGIESIEEITRFLRGIAAEHKVLDNKRPQKLPEAIEYEHPKPLLRHHLGLPSLEETIKSAREIAEAGVLDILSIAPDQNAQEYLFNPAEMDLRLDGSGGVPIRKAEDLASIYSATRCGNYPLVRCYAGTQNLIRWAEMLLETINIAWGAVPLSWYSQLDGRSKRSVSEAIKENQQAIQWYAQHDVPVEVNESHQWALRNTSDVIEIVTAFLASYTAKKMGVGWYIMQYMFNTPPGISPEMDLAKMLAKTELIENLQNKNFICYRMVRTGLGSLSADPDVAKGQLAASIAISMVLRPQIVHVVGYSEGDHAATSREIIESCKIAKGVIMNSLYELPNPLSNNKIQNRKNELLEEASILLESIRNIADQNVEDPWICSETLAKAIRIGLLDAPHLKGNSYAKGYLETKIIDGACYAINTQTKTILSEKERVVNILNEWRGHE